MQKYQYWRFLALGLLLPLMEGRAHALPGQSPNEVAAWIQAHPTLQPAAWEKLMVQKSDTAAQRYTFQASPLQVGKASTIKDSAVIRTERFSLFDIINGVTAERLEESLRNIYGPALYQDYVRAKIVYTYPNPIAENQIPKVLPVQGELREGERFAYWLEVAQNPQGKANSGQITVFLKEDLNKLKTELMNRK
jgi:hypothetical protein